MRIAILVTILTLIISCNTNTNSNESATDTSSQVDQSKKDGDLSGCYWKIMDRDTFVLHLQQSNESITGKLTFNNFQKDKSSGPIQGKVDRNIIKLWYNFQSEGMESIMEVYFKREDGQLLRGLGPVEVKGNSSYFKDADSIEYSSEQAFTRVDCSLLPTKYH